MVGPAIEGAAQLEDQHEFPADPYAVFRGDGHVWLDLGEGPFVLFVGYDDVREACRDWRAFTSDTPFEVPIPHEHGVRGVRQIPIETDPPDHTAYRELVGDLFSRSGVEAHAVVVRDVVDEIIGRVLDGDVLDVIPDLALPVVNHGLAAALGRPQHEAELWMTWGVHVFSTSESGEKTANAELDDYLERTVDLALQQPDDGFFGTLASAEFRGRSLTREQMLGFGNLVFAGGRDTVAGSIAAALWYFGGNASEWQRLRDDRRLIRPAVEEIIRLSTPLPFIGRHATARCRHAGADVAEGALVALGFAAANRDPQIFDRPDTCVLDRHPNRHVAFGHGPHTCSGSYLARMEIRVTLERLAEAVSRIEPVGDARFLHFDVHGHRVPYGVEDVRVRLRS